MAIRFGNVARNLLGPYAALLVIVLTVPVLTAAVDRSAVADGGLQKQPASVEEAIHWLEAKSKEMIRVSRRMMKSGIAAFPPQAGSGYEAFWLRDYAYMLEGCPEAFSDLELRNACLMFVNATGTDGAGVDCVKFDGTPIYKPGFGTLGENPVADGGPFTVDVAWHTHRRLQDRRLVIQIVDRLVKAMETAPRNPKTGMVYIKPEGYDRCPYGFTDTVRKQGDELFTLLLWVQAARQLSDLLTIVGRAEEAGKWQAEAERIVAAIPKVFWDEKMGLFRAATIKCREPDIWGSTFAVYLGVASREQSLRIARYFKDHYKEIVEHGQLRHLPNGVYWEAACPRDTYQNGGYWATPVGWFIYTLDSVDRKLADRTLLDLVEDFQKRGVTEWVRGDHQAVRNYIASATMPLAGARAVLKRRDGQAKPTSSPSTNTHSSLWPQIEVSVKTQGLPDKTAGRPHILVIHADQLRFDCLGAYGNRQVKTPNIDSLASEGVRFSNSFCSFPVCAPSRYSFLSGLPVHVHRGWNNHCTLPPGTATFPAVLREAGYHTKAVGKMHFTPTYLNLGFTEMELAEQDGPGRWDDDYHRYLHGLGLVDADDLEDQVAEFRKNARGEYWETCGALVSNLDEHHHSTTWIGDRAVETLNKWDATTPSLLVVGFIKPHHPFDPPGHWAKMYDPQQMMLLPGWIEKPLACDLALGKGYFPNQDLSQAVVRRCMAYYYATISQIDFQVGRMIAVLKRKGLYSRTLIVFTADHGEYLGFHHLLLKGNHMYDPLAKVPLIIRYPGGQSANTVSDKLASNIDVAPTILAAAGLKPSRTMKGLDLADASAQREIVFCETGAHVMARTRTGKLLWNSAQPDKSLFFDLQVDPLEMKNLFRDPQWQEEIGRLVRAAQAWRPAILPGVYLDEDAPQIRQPNVPSRDRSHRAAIMGWYRGQMLRWQSTASPK